ncbi:hypothetical protein BpHYR1_008172 [Brachionus plicatilis]|uniref:Uncharacterized protein n=1 Tax=Brachionus plicatilis TaxID=10195 RepID=A0A3M7PRE7_BRAPC|nr:hypothetical protein BpHYR1_008172 [Brachionus plicatilis]
MKQLFVKGFISLSDCKNTYLVFLNLVLLYKQKKSKKYTIYHGNKILLLFDMFQIFWHHACFKIKRFV